MNFIRSHRINGSIQYFLVIGYCCYEFEATTLNEVNNAETEILVVTGCRHNTSQLLKRDQHADK